MCFYYSKLGRKVRYSFWDTQIFSACFYEIKKSQELCLSFNNFL